MLRFVKDYVLYAHLTYSTAQIYVNCAYAYYTHIRVWVYAHMRMSIRTYTYKYTHIRVYVYAHMRTVIRAYTHIHARLMCLCYSRRKLFFVFHCCEKERVKATIRQRKIKIFASSHLRSCYKHTRLIASCVYWITRSSSSSALSFAVDESERKKCYLSSAFKLMNYLAILY